MYIIDFLSKGIKKKESRNDWSRLMAVFWPQKKPYSLTTQDVLKDKICFFFKILKMRSIFLLKCNAIFLAIFCLDDMSSLGMPSIWNHKSINKTEQNSWLLVCLSFAAEWKMMSLYDFIFHTFIFRGESKLEIITLSILDCDEKKV